MRTSGVAQLLIAVGLLAAALSPLAFDPAPNPGVDPPDPAGEASVPGGYSYGIDDDRLARHYSRFGTEGEPTASVDRQVRVVADLKAEVDVPDRIERKYAEVYTQQGTRRLSGTLSLSEVRSLSSTRGIEAVHIVRSPDVSDQYVASGVDRVGAAALHDRGLTGENVTVGVIDSGFKVSHPELAEHVGAYRPFARDGSTVHGTAVASVVADVAPDAELHLAAIGPTTTPAEYREAVDWLRESGADVVVDAGSYLGQTGDGSGPISRIAANASEEMTFVTSAGNYANRHWAGVHRPENGTGWVTFERGLERNYLDGGNKFSGRVVVGLQWNGSANYDLFLYRDSRGDDRVWAASTGGENAENLSVTLPRGRYYLAVRPNESMGVPERPHRVELFANRWLAHHTSSGSLTSPATAPGVVAVGTTEDGSAASFSSRGPTVDGRRGVDLVAPDDVALPGVDVGVGTSFAAPYVAGTVALLEDANPDVDPSSVTRAVVRSADDVGAEGPDPATGFGRLDAQAASEYAAQLAAVEALGEFDDRHEQWLDEALKRYAEERSALERSDESSLDRRILGVADAGEFREFGVDRSTADG